MHITYDLFLWNRTLLRIHAYDLVALNPTTFTTLL